jgi:hypothetical protein
MGEGGMKNNNNLEQWMLPQEEYIQISIGEKPLKSCALLPSSWNLLREAFSVHVLLG